MIDLFEPQRIQPCLIQCACLSPAHRSISKRVTTSATVPIDLSNAATARHGKPCSIRSRRWYCRLPMPVWDPRQIATQNIDSKRASHEGCAYPEAPVAMHAPPVWTRIGLSSVAAISFLVVLASCHFVSISCAYPHDCNNSWRFSKDPRFRDGSCAISGMRLRGRTNQPRLFILCKSRENGAAPTYASGP